MIHRFVRTRATSQLPRSYLAATSRSARTPQRDMRDIGQWSLVTGAISEQELHAIRLHLQRQHALGPDAFRASIETQLGRRAGPAKIGRPRKNLEAGETALSYLDDAKRNRDVDLDGTAGSAEADSTLGD